MQILLREKSPYKYMKHDLINKQIHKCLALNYSYFGSYCHIPIFLVDVDPYENLLSFKRNVVLLHTGTFLIGLTYNLFVSTYKFTIQLLSYQLF